MKNILLLFVLQCCTIIATAQTDNDWMISVDFGVQEHDKRLYHWPKFPRKNLLARTPENYGTYQWAISVSRQVIHNNRFNIYTGLGLSTELATFFRPFDHLYREEFGDQILRYTNRYYQNLIQLPFSIKYRPIAELRFALDILPQFNFLTVADNTENESFAWWQFGLYSIELNPGIEYSIGKFNVGMKYRLFQFKRIDPILFHSTGVYTMGDEKFETFNPFKLWFSVGYSL